MSERRSSTSSHEMERKIDRLSRDCQRLREERNRFREERDQQKDEILELKAEKEKFGLRLQEFKSNNESFGAENNRLKNECKESENKCIEYKARYDQLGKALEIYKIGKKAEINKLKAELENEKQNCTSGLSQAMTVSFNQKIDKLWDEKQDLLIKLNNERKKSAETDGLKQEINDLKEKCMDLTQRLDYHNKHFDKFKKECKSEVMKLKNSHHTQVVSLKRQRNYFENLNNKHKRSLLAAQYLNVGHEQLLRRTGSKIFDSIEINKVEFEKNLIERIVQVSKEQLQKLKSKDTAVIADVVRSNFANSEILHKNAEKFMEKLKDGQIKCLMCSNIFVCLTSVKKHMALKHLIKMDSYFGSERLVGKVIDTLDITDD